jgi:enoyl-CoA hydratase
MNYKNLVVEIEDKIAIVKINRPDKLNALNYETLNELESCFREIKEDDTIYSSIITGSGEKAFVAGADITELSKLNLNTAKKFSDFGQSVFNLIEKNGKPVIAAVNGFALGGGCELALACHIRIASENAKFGQPEVNLGIIPGYGGTQRLAKLCGSGIAAELILTGDLINAEEALKIGLVNKIYPQNQLIEKAKELCNKINSKGTIAVRMALNAIVESSNLGLSEGQNLESTLFAICAGSKDFAEGTSAFLEKRNPNFLNK